MSRLVNSKYKIYKASMDKNLRIVILSDLHSRPYTDIDSIVALTKAQNPDLVAMPGDIFECLDGTRGEWKRAGFELIRQIREFAPVFFSIGNHENGGNLTNALRLKRGTVSYRCDEGEISHITESGAVVLDDGFTVYNGIAIGGLTSGNINKDKKPNVDRLNAFFRYDGPKILLCHHPEYYEEYLKDKNIDLIVSGHAHGGQWRFFGRGVYSPGQGLFPKYTSGVHDGKLVISKGLKPPRFIPRLFNPTEIVTVDIISKNNRSR